MPDGNSEVELGRDSQSFPLWQNRFGASHETRGFSSPAMNLASYKSSVQSLKKNRREIRGKALSLFLGGCPTSTNEVYVLQSLPCREVLVVSQLPTCTFNSWQEGVELFHEPGLVNKELCAGDIRLSAQSAGIMI